MHVEAQEPAAVSDSTTRRLAQGACAVAAVALLLWLSESPDPAEQERRAELAAIQECLQERFKSENGPPDKAQSAKCDAMRWAYKRKHGREPA